MTKDEKAERLQLIKDRIRILKEENCDNLDEIEFNELRVETLEER